MNLRFMELAIVGALVAGTAAQAQDQDQQHQRDRAAAHQAQARDQKQENRDARQDNRAVRQENRAVRQDNRAVRRDNQIVRQDRRIENRDFSTFRRNVQATRRFRDGGWRPPVGYSYRRWTFGERLPPAYFGRQYWLNNWAAFALFAPPPGLVWVRYGPDAMLIDPVSGEIVQVRYGVFY